MENSKTTFPKLIKVWHFNQDDDTRDIWNAKYSYEQVVNNAQEESDYYCSLNHEANLKIEVL